MAPSRLALISSALLALITPSFAQTFTDCNPLNVTCPPNPALGTNATWDFSAETADSAIWNVTQGPMSYGSNGAEFKLTSKGDAPTIGTTFYIFGGEVTVTMKPASGVGIISSIVLESIDLDEVDWEFMGGNRTHVETNYFGKGNTTTFDRATYVPMPDGSAPQDDWHAYTVKWTQQQLEWSIDGTVIRTLKYEDANGHGLYFPQTPMNVRLGIWAGGDSAQPKGTIEWAGGVTDYKEGPFSMFVKSVYVKDYSTGAAEYTFGDHTGSWDSIKVTQGQSAAAKGISSPHTLTGKWAALSKTAQTAIIACSIAGGVLLAIALLACCWHQARKGRKEKAIADAKYEKERAEFDQYRDAMMKGGYAYSSQPVQQPQPTYYQVPLHQSPYYQGPRY